MNPNRRTFIQRAFAAITTLFASRSGVKAESHKDDMVVGEYRIKIVKGDTFEFDAKFYRAVITRKTKDGHEWIAIESQNLGRDDEPEIRHIFFDNLACVLRLDYTQQNGLPETEFDKYCREHPEFIRPC